MLPVDEQCSLMFSVVEFQVSRLIYTNSGCGVLALASNAVHKLWKWQKGDHNLAFKVSLPPCLLVLDYFYSVRWEYVYLLFLVMITTHLSNYGPQCFVSRQRLVNNQYYGNLQVGLR